ncbi:hypothetical protein GN244_ATG10284 [Phytophthora infestans]|uniref:Uncharacterized protein n=1 Tax=Phytophthora infestans TaxID=4787 RepID=A0A833WJ79_PHYIN|nr:hypothetical protein GN244_ATG10284 [Phytophthora infestans]
MILHVGGAVRTSEEKRSRRQCNVTRTALQIFIRRPHSF